MNDSTILLADTMNWMKISKTYIAQGGEKYITIGCFSQQTGLDTVQVYPIQCQYCDGTYYDIDDVSVTLDDSTNGIGELDAASKIRVYPNPAKEQFTICNELPSTTAAVVELYSIIGTLQQKQKLHTGNNTINTEPLSNGVYFYKITSKQAIIKQGKIVVSN